MNKFDDNPANPAGKTSGSMRRLLSDGTPSLTAPAPAITTAPLVEPVRAPFNLSQYIIPAVLVLVLLVGVGIMAYSFGVSRGETNANAKRDAFIESRQRSWDATATALAANPLPTAAPGATDPASAKVNGYTLGPSTLGRVDKIEGDKITVLLLDDSGKPSGSSLIINRTRTTQVWKTVPTQAAELRIGDSVLFVGERNNDGFDARTIQILPSNS